MVGNALFTHTGIKVLCGTIPGAHHHGLVFFSEYTVGAGFEIPLIIEAICVHAYASCNGHQDRHSDRISPVSSSITSDSLTP